MTATTTEPTVACYHPRSCNRCDYRGGPCGTHHVGDVGHDRCSGPAPTDVSTPSLVREFVAIKCADARGERTTSARHNRLGVIVDELRARGVLD